MVNRNVLAAIPLTFAVLLAGCATPEESVDLTNGTGDAPPVETTPEYVMIDGRPYECHDTVNVDGVCDDYELDEGYTGAGDAMQVTSTDGSVRIGGHDYRCTDMMGPDVDVTDTTDDTGPCETYRLVG